MSNGRTFSDQAAIAAGQNTRERDYWLSRLEGLTAVSDFPALDGAAAAVAGEEVALLPFRLPDAVTAQADKLCGGSDIRLHILLTAALALLLRRYGGTEDIVVGSPILKQVQFADFINTALPFRLRGRPETSFKEWLLQTRETVAGASEHQNYPLEFLAERLGLENAAGDCPFFAVALLLEPLHDAAYLERVSWRMLWRFRRCADGLGGEIEYRRGGYDPGMVERLPEHFARLLQAALGAVEAPLAALEMLSAEERERLLHGFNAVAGPAPAASTVLQEFLVCALRQPTSEAVYWQDGREGVARTLSYGELQRRSAALGHRLRTAGATGRVVALLLDHSPDMIAALLAVWQAGAAYLPIDGDDPPERIDFVMRDSGAALLLTQHSLENRCHHACPRLYIEDDSLYDPLPEGFVPTLPDPADPAYIIYTSGSTGRPKGVVVRHRNLHANVSAFLHEFDLDADTCVAQLASYAFDAFAEEVFPVLLRGGRLAIPGPGEWSDMDLMWEFLRRQRVSMVDCTPLLLNELNRRPSWPDLRWVVSGGDVLKPQYIDRFPPTVRIYNTYGPTETTICATYHRLGGETAGRIPIGRPIAGYRVYIVNARGELCPCGVPGELCIAGAGLSAGYLNRPELTAERFAPLAAAGGESVYRSGDLARWRPDGVIEFCGRIDRQVKIRGFRIETDEIEKRLLDFPVVRDAAVFVRDEAGGDKQLCAALVLEDEVLVGELRRFLAERLPYFMIPAFFLRVDGIPRTVNGKVDWRALHRQAGRTLRSADYVAPQTEMENLVAAVWQEMLEIERVGIHDNFFEIGGNSLKLIGVHARLKEVLQRDIVVASLFRFPTVHTLAAHLAAEEETGQPAEPEPVEEDRGAALERAKRERQQRYQRRKGDQHAE